MTVTSQGHWSSCIPSWTQCGRPVADFWSTYDSFCGIVTILPNEKAERLIRDDLRRGLAHFRRKNNNHNNGIATTSQRRNPRKQNKHKKRSNNEVTTRSTKMMLVKHKKPTHQNKKNDKNNKNSDTIPSTTANVKSFGKTRNGIMFGDV
eukprot:CAMPEP_0178831410 /NCGR_PEP_ID=MMETSP0746-20121128/9441_1 /TAXON_ID=913974 /ORGANISM="Nitzschia punctata, Strain CCMP561" /LENGTH=148 /DNA_ID=CAMNT_0020493641 /DNA_START=246 /DNA_END=692 /DNA_ORIENTATION=-